MNYNKIKKIKSRRKFSIIMLYTTLVATLEMIVIGFILNSTTLACMPMVMVIVSMISYWHMVMYGSILSKYIIDVKSFRDYHFLSVIIGMVNRNEFDDAIELFNKSKIDNPNIISTAHMLLLVKQCTSNDDVNKRSGLDEIMDIENIYINKYECLKKNFN